MRNLTIILLALSVVHAPWPASASDKDGIFVVRGLGGNSCGQWTTARKGNDAYAHGQWVLGVVSAYNLYRWTATSDIAQDTDGTGLLAWVDNYCASHPLEQISDAALALLKELSGRYYRAHPPSAASVSPPAPSATPRSRASAGASIGRGKPPSDDE